MTVDRSTGPGPDTARHLSRWQDLIRERFVALDIDSRPERRTFRGSIGHTHSVGTLDVARVSSDAQTFRRTSGLISRYGEDFLQVGHLRTGTARLEQDGRACALQAGQFAVYDTTRPFTWTMHGPWTMDVLTWPRRALVADDRRAQSLTAQPLGAGPTGQVARAVMDELGRLDGDLGGADGIVLSARVADLVVGAATWTTGSPDDRPAAPDPRVDVILDFIELHLEDPHLNPAHVARQFHLSQRSLQRLFADQPRGVADWIRYRRLDRARADLADPRRSVTSVAAQYCFSSPTIFARAFRGEFGIRPHDARSDGPGAR
ncbi:helix-turn-helix domain-containing protein [Pseudonocardia endophytica]|nr:helix-turn-helix domain-containing protein [Pseudonocardia endophytica]